MEGSHKTTPRPADSSSPRTSPTVSEVVPVVLALHGLVALVALAGGRRGRRTVALAAVAPLATAAWAASSLDSILDGAEGVVSTPWVPSLGLSLDLRLDAYALLFVLVIAVAGTLILLYASRYLPDRPATARFAALMVFFAGSMTGLVLSDHLLTVFVFWELTTISSYLLIGHEDRTASARSAALHAALVTGAGGLALLAGLVLLGTEAGTWQIGELVAASPRSTVGWVLVLLGAMTKSAQIPFHSWLPGAMAAPTPASAFLHSATMVKAGIFLLGRLSPGVTATWWEPVVLSVGLATMVVGGWRALRQTDLKLLLAYGTVAQLGFLFALVGSGRTELVHAGLALLVAHAAFKATLFLVVGAIDHEAGTRDLRRLDRLGRRMPALAAVAGLACASMAGLPLTAGFVAKEAGLHALAGESLGWVLTAAAASVLTVAYTGRFLVGAFGPAEPGVEPVGEGVHRPRGILVGAPAVLAVVGILLGVFPAVTDALVGPAAEAVTASAGDGALAVWPAPGLELALSLGSLVVGSLLVWRWRLVAGVLGAVARITGRIPEGRARFGAAIGLLTRGADRLTGLIQSGSLPAYLVVIAAVAIALPSTSLVGAPRSPLAAPGAFEVVTAGIIIAAALALTVMRRRFAAVLLLGLVGYGVAAIYALYGGVDLVLTQLLIETLAVALFALVLRRLPAELTAPRAHPLRVGVAVALATFVVGGALTATAARQTAPVSDAFPAAAAEAGGENIVNVVLVDIRGFDTFGEITVLVVAALGAAGLVIPLVRSRRR